MTSHTTEESILTKIQGLGHEEQRRAGPDGGHAWIDPDRASPGRRPRPAPLRCVRDRGHSRQLARRAPHRWRRRRTLPSDPLLHAPTHSLATIVATVGGTDSYL